MDDIRLKWSSLEVGREGWREEEGGGREGEGGGREEEREGGREGGRGGRVTIKSQFQMQED